LGASKTQLVIYTRLGCHLCEALIEELSEFCTKNPFSFTDIDISGDDNLEQLYGLKVPVVTFQQTILCEYFLDANAITAYFGKLTQN